MKWPPSSWGGPVGCGFITGSRCVELVAVLLHSGVASDVIEGWAVAGPFPACSNGTPCCRVGGWVMQLLPWEVLRGFWSGWIARLVQAGYC